MFIRSVKRRIKQALSLFLLIFLAGIPPSYGADYTIANPNLLEEYFWTYGCTPTASSMILSYWDNYVAGTGKNLGYGRLVNYYYDNSCGNSGLVPWNVPNTIDELRTALATDWNLTTCTGTGETFPLDIEGGMRAVTNDRNGYDFTYRTCWDVLGTALDWCWGEMTNQIDNGRPFLWSTGQYFPIAGHSVPAWGYRDDKYVIIYDTWSPGGREDWYYKYFLGDPSAPVKTAMVNALTPGGSPSPDDILLDEPYRRGDPIRGSRVRHLVAPVGNFNRYR